MTALPFDLGPAGAGFLALAVLGASYVRGYCGFGFAALTIAASALVTDPRQMVAVVILADLLMSAQQVPGVLRQADWSRVRLLFLGALFGVPAGVALLAGMGAGMARIAVSLFILAICALLWSGWRLSRTVGPAGTGAVGLLSGFANAAGVGGLPVAGFLAAQPVPAPIFRATLIVYFALLDLWSLPVMARAGMVSADTVVAVLATLPLMLAGLWLGSRRFGRAAPDDFRRFAIALLAVLAGLGLVRSWL